MKLRSALSEGGFEIRQWSSNCASVIDHLPEEARSLQTDLWLSHDCNDPCEGTLGMSWHCLQDSLGYKHRPVDQSLTLRILYRILARQYDPLGFIIPFTTRAKIMLQQLWIKPGRGWDDPDIPEGWMAWEKELSGLSKIQVPRWYGSVGSGEERRELHVFCDASERAYGAESNLHLSNGNEVVTSFVMARSRVSPKKITSIPRLELCAALAGSQLANLLVKELSVPLHKVTLWTDSTTVLTWICSESCQYKIFVANRITEILDYTTPEQWRYVDTGNNPADEITRGKKLTELSPASRWFRGPPFLALPPHQWPKYPITSPDEVSLELRKPLFCSQTQVSPSLSKVDPVKFNKWSELVADTMENFSPNQVPENKLSQNQAELLLLRQAQEEDFSEESKLLQLDKGFSAHSRLVELAPEWDPQWDRSHKSGRSPSAERGLGVRSYPSYHSGP